MRNPLDNKILFLKVKKQDKEAYGQFYDLYVNRIYRFIFFKVNSVNDAQDLTSEVFLKLWQKLRDGHDIKNLNSFIYMMARNIVIDFYRAKSRTETSLNEGIKDKIDNSKDLLTQQMANSELQGVLQGLDKMKDEYREVIVLKFLDELSVREIAEILNKTTGAVRVLIHRALKALKNNLRDE